MDQALTVELRDLAPNDSEWIFRACQDAEIQRFTLVPRPYLQEHADDFVVSRVGKLRVWGIEVNRDAVGVIGLHSIDLDTGDAAIGYWIAPWGRRLGAASTAIRLVCDLVAKMPGVKRATALIASTNLASQATAERANFVRGELVDETCPDGEQQVPALRYVRALSI